MKKRVALKRIIIVFACFVAAFIIINLAWLFLIKMPYDDFCKKSEQRCTNSKFTENEAIAYNTYYDTEQGYGYKIYRPEYLGFAGLTLVIGDNRHMTSTMDMMTREITSEDEPMMVINLVRNLFGRYTIVLEVMDNIESIYGVTVDKDLTIIDSISAKERERMNNIIGQNETHLMKNDCKRIKAESFFIPAGEKNKDGRTYME